jgi:mannose-6-phosphate isomerase-like protein (cupin superfamily)
MFIRELKDCEEFIAGDNCTLREILHPDKENLALRYSLAHAIVKPGDTTWRHRLKTSEVYYILEGEGVMHIENENAPVRSGSRLDGVYPADGDAVHHEFREHRPKIHLHR